MPQERPPTTVVHKEGSCSHYGQLTDINVQKNASEAAS